VRAPAPAAHARAAAQVAGVTSTNALYANTSTGELLQMRPGFVKRGVGLVKDAPPAAALPLGATVLAPDPGRPAGYAMGRLVSPSAGGGGFGVLFDQGVDNVAKLAPSSLRTLCYSYDAP
jgi:hypothetical protein